MTTLNAEFTGKDNNWQNGTTTYWFDVDGTVYGVVHSEGDTSIVDDEGYPVNTNDCEFVHLNALVDCVTDEMICG